MSTRAGEYDKSYDPYAGNRPYGPQTPGKPSLAERACEYIGDNIFTPTGAIAAGAVGSSAYALKQAGTYHAIVRGMQSPFASKAALLRVPMSVISKAISSARLGAIGGSFVAGLCIGTLMYKGFTWLNDGVSLGEQLYEWFPDLL
jgi:hypothetical protein